MSDWSVIIPTLNEEKTIGFLLNDLRAQTKPPREIMIVDAGSVDATEQVVKKHIAQVTKTMSIKFVKSKPPVGGQRTVGGKLAQFENICFLDADVRLQPNFFEKIAEFKQRHGLVTACPEYIPFRKAEQNSAHEVPAKLVKSSLHIRAVYAAFNLLFKLGQDRYPSGAGSCIITTKAVAQKVGWFQEKYLSDDIAYIRHSARYGFSMLPIKVYVSDRRWRKYGFFSTLFTYLKMSRAFMKNDFLNPKTYNYEFGKYE
jgi:glycosyltransferase involved in cell wall biosynthesis